MPPTLTFRRSTCGSLRIGAAACGFLATLSNDRRSRRSPSDAAMFAGVIWNGAALGDGLAFGCDGGADCAAEMPTAMTGRVNARAPAAAPRNPGGSKARSRRMLGITPRTKYLRLRPYPGRTSQETSAVKRQRSELQIGADGETVPVAVAEEGADRFVQFVHRPGLALSREHAVEGGRLHHADPAGVDDDHIARDVIRGAGAEPDDDRGDVLDRPGVDLVAVRRRRERRLGHGGAGARGQRVRAHAITSAPVTDSEGERGDAGFRGGVVGLARRAEEEGLGRGVDDAWPLRLTGRLVGVAPVGGRGLTRGSVATEVDPQDRVPLVGADREDHPVAQHAGVVDEHIDVAVLRDRAADQRGREVPVTDVAGHADGLAPGRRDLFRNGVRGVADVVDDDLRARRRQRHGLDATETDSGTGDDSHAALELRAGELRHQRLHLSTPNISADVGTPVPPVTSTCSTSVTWLTDVPRTWRTPSAIPFMPCR